MVNAWDGDRLVAHYGGYKVPLWRGSHAVAVHIADTMTDPACRSIGRGATSVLARIIRLSRRLHAEDKTPFIYGFSTGKHQKFGKMFLGHQVARPVYEWIAGRKSIDRHVAKTLWPCRLRGLKSARVNSVEWADDLFQRVRGSYGWLVERSAPYLKWRYLDHPDFDHVIVAVKHKGTVAGYWVARVVDQELWIGDVLFDPGSSRAPVVSLAFLLQYLISINIEIDSVRGWFATSPKWWTGCLSDMGFRKKRERFNLDLTVSYGKAAPGEIGDKMYFTWGDSDLF